MALLRRESTDSDRAPLAAFCFDARIRELLRLPVVASDSTSDASEVACPDAALPPATCAFRRARRPCPRTGSRRLHRVFFLWQKSQAARYWGPSRRSSRVLSTEIQHVACRRLQLSQGGS